MNKYSAFGISGLILTVTAFAGENLYTIGPQFNPDPTPAAADTGAAASSGGGEDLGDYAILSNLPINWSVGSDFTYDDNVLPGAATKEDAFGVSPYVTAGYTRYSPQTTIDLYAKLGMVYYFDAPDAMDDVNSSSRLALDITHNVSERVRIESKNFISYELEPNYAYGYASSRAGQEHIYMTTDNSVGYRWSERLGTKTGLSLSGTQYQDVANQDRTGWQLYNQFRYVLTPKSIATFDYRYGVTSGDDAASDSTNQYLLLGMEHRFSPNTIGAFKLGAQFRDVDNGDDSSSPYMEASVTSQINEQFRVRGFTRYGIESYDTVHPFAVGLVEYDEKNTLRIGVNSSYDVSPLLSVFGGLDYITTQYEAGRVVATGAGFGDSDEDFVTANVGVAYQIKEGLTGRVTYTYTDSESDIGGRSYDRNRISVGVNAEF